MKPVRVAVAGATGYAGAEIVRLLAAHPCAQVVTATSERGAGKPLREFCPWLSSDLGLTAFDSTAVEADFVFLCQEAGFAMKHAAELAARSRVVDLSADFRIRDSAVYEKYYNREPAASDLLGEAVYGLPELVDRDDISGARLIANPGCFPTAALLGLMPLIRAGWVSGVPVIDAKSGASGAGRSKVEGDFMLSELGGGFKPYAAVGHRHTPEMEQMAGMAVRFTPHLMPVSRGLIATLHVPLSKASSRGELRQVFDSAYANCPFVRLQDALPSSKQVLGSNVCAIAVDYDARVGMAVVCSAIDNLVKGAAGQAIQNMNLMAGLPEQTGLPLDGVWP